MDEELEVLAQPEGAWLQVRTRDGLQGRVSRTSVYYREREPARLRDCSTHSIHPGQHVEYNSNGRWIGAIVDYVHSDGTVDLEVMHRTWISQGVDRRFIRALNLPVQRWVTQRPRGAERPRPRGMRRRLATFNSSTSESSDDEDTARALTESIAFAEAKEREDVARAKAESAACAEAEERERMARACSESKQSAERQRRARRAEAEEREHVAHAFSESKQSAERQRRARHNMTPCIFMHPEPEPEPEPEPASPSQRLDHHKCYKCGSMVSPSAVLRHRDDTPIVRSGQFATFDFGAMGCLCHECEKDQDQHVYVYSGGGGDGGGTAPPVYRRPRTRSAGLLFEHFDGLST